MILCGCGHMFDWLGSQADVHSAVFILFRWLWHAAWMHWCWQWMWGEPDSWQHLHFSELMQDDLSHDTRPQPVIYTATAVMWVKWAEIREKWQEERKEKKKEGRCRHYFAQAYFIWMKTIFILHLRSTFYFYGLEQHWQPIFACCLGECVCPGQALGTLWAGPVPHPLWLLEKHFSLLLGMHKHQPEVQGIKENSFELNNCMLKLGPVTTVYIL